MIFDIVLIVAGLILLVLGGEALVRGASTLASKAGISPLVIGLVVVSAATSAPEFAVSVGAVFNGEPDLAIGNVVGSNIVNILLILGLSALVKPLLIKRQLVRLDIPVMLIISVVLFLLSLDGALSRLDGLLLLLALIAHTIVSLVMGRKETQQTKLANETLPLNSKPVPIWFALLLLILGVALLVFGAQTLVAGAVSIATSLGVSSLVIGLTVVAIGTSLPELATSVVAVRKGEGDMAVGNIVGSNIFNIGMVLGVPALIFNSGIPVSPAVVAVDLPLMLAAALTLLPLAFTGFVLARWEGATFLLLYIGYTLYLVLDSTGHDAATGFAQIMLWLVMPLLAATLVALTSYEIGLNRGKRSPGSKLDGEHNRSQG